MNTKEKIVLRLDASYKIKHEKYEGFKRSFFRNIYNQASKNVREIIKTTDTDLAYKEKSGYTEPISNLITFDGKRGSGKTSAMLSFCDFLSRFNDYRVERSENVCDNLLELRDSVSFTVLDCTDATLLVDSKELIGAVLGKMLTAIKEREKSNAQLSQLSNVAIRKLRTRLGEIYCSMLPQDTNRDEASPWEVLEQLSRSWNQQQAFRDSVQQFNEYMSESEGIKKQNYLVIPIDDVDMNIQNGYALLEAIRKYLMVPNVIVLLAADDYQLEVICRQAFSKGIESKNDSVLAQKLALEYLEKLIPSGRRIYMPDLYREDNLYTDRIKISQDEEEEKRGESQTIKETIIRNVWKYVGIILNKDDENCHWLQPHSLRKLSNYINAMHFLPETLGGEEERGEFYGNIDWFYEDIIKRYLPDAERQYSEKDRKWTDKEIEKIIRKFEDEVPAKKLEKLINGLRDYTHDTAFEEKSILESYGNISMLLYRMQEGDFSEICRAISFILSLRMRRLIYSIENDGMGDDKYREMLEFSKGDFWGEYDRIWLQKMGISNKIYDFECEVSVKDLLEDLTLTRKDIFLLAIQLGIKNEGETVDGEIKCKGSLRLGNFVNGIFDYEGRINEIAELICRAGGVSEEEKRELESVGNELIGEFATWEKKYGTSRVIPFDSVEFMFGIFDKLFGDQGVFHEFETEEEYVQMYRKALKKIRDILGEYDEYFKRIRESYQDGKCGNILMKDLTRKYKDIYTDCPFIQFANIADDNNNNNNNNNVVLKYISLFQKQDNNDGKKPEDKGTGGQEGGRTKPAEESPEMTE